MVARDSKILAETPNFFGVLSSFTSRPFPPRWTRIHTPVLHVEPRHIPYNGGRTDAVATDACQHTAVRMPAPKCRFSLLLKRCVTLSHDRSRRARGCCGTRLPKIRDDLFVLLLRYWDPNAVQTLPPASNEFIDSRLSFWTRVSVVSSLRIGRSRVCWRATRPRV